MNETSKPKIATFQIKIRVSKEDSAMVYFTLEANEGLCFYSTLDSTPGQEFRVLEIQGAIEFETELKRILGTLQKSFLIQYL